MTATSVNSDSSTYIDMTCGMLWSTPISWVASSTTLGMIRVPGSNGFSSDSALLFGLKSVSSMLISQRNNDKQGKRQLRTRVSLWGAAMTVSSAQPSGI